MKNGMNGQRLMVAIREGNVDSVCSLLDEGYSPDTTDEANIPGLVISAQAGHAEVVEILLAAGANWSRPLVQIPGQGNGEWGGYQKPGAMAIWAAATAGHQDVIRVLQPIMNKWFGGILVRICGEGNLAALRTLLATINIKRFSSYGLIQAASSKGQIDIVEVLVNAGMDVNTVDMLTESPPLVVAAENGYLDIVKVLVAAGALVDDGMGAEAPLLAAAHEGRVEVYN